MRLFQKLKAKKIAKVEEEIKKLRERDPMEDIEKYIKIGEFLLENIKKITPNSFLIKEVESTLKESYQKKANLEALRES